MATLGEHRFVLEVKSMVMRRSSRNPRLQVTTTLGKTGHQHRTQGAAIRSARTP